MSPGRRQLEPQILAAKDRRSPEPELPGQALHRSRTLARRAAASAGRVGLVALAALAVAGWGNGPRLQDIRFEVTSVSLNGPNTIPGGGSANYTVTVNIKRTGAKQSDTIVGTSGTRIRPSLFQDNTQLTFTEIDFAPGENSKTVTLSLRCRSGEVVGSVNGTGHGKRLTFLWWSWDDPAHVKARLNETDSGAKNVMCN